MFVIATVAVMLTMIVVDSVAHPPLRFLALGDSYTIGESVATSERWPDQLVARLHERGIIVSDMKIIAKTGWTTDELNSAIDHQRLTPPYDCVSLMIGVNNQYRERSIDEYRTQFRGLLHRAIGYAGRRADHVVVLSIPD